MTNNSAVKIYPLRFQFFPILDEEPDNIKDFDGWNNIFRITNLAEECQICRKEFNSLNQVNIHLNWYFKQGMENIQRLANIIPICSRCHKTIHANLCPNEYYDNVLKYYSFINKVSIKKAEEEYSSAISLYNKYLKINWKLDIYSVYEIIDRLNSIEI